MKSLKGIIWITGMLTLFGCGDLSTQPESVMDKGQSVQSDAAINQLSTELMDPGDGGEIQDPGSSHPGTDKRVSNCGDTYSSCTTLAFWDHSRNCFRDYSSCLQAASID